MYYTEHNKLASLLTPTKQRKIKFLSLIRCFMAPVQIYQNEFELNRSKNVYKLNHNGQICKLCAVLNDQFDRELRRIYISDGGDKDVLLIHKDTDQKLVQLPITVHKNEDYDYSGYDFVVVIPSDISFTIQVELHMMSLLNFYKLAGKRFKINIA